MSRGEDEMVEAAEKAMLEVGAVFVKIREALAAERYVEADGWSERLQDTFEGLRDALGQLAAVEANAAVEDFGQ